MRLENAILKKELLADGEYNVYSIPKRGTEVPRSGASDVSTWLWVAPTWVIFGGLMVFLVMEPGTTWIGFRYQSHLDRLVHYAASC